MADKFSKVNFNDYKPLRDVIFEALREAIIIGELKPGERLMEIQLSEKMGVSRTPVREAIRKLELEGFVDMIPRRGAQVADLSNKQIADVLEVRASLDGLATQLATQRITKDELDALKNIQAQFCASVEKENIQGAIKKDAEFHDIIYSASRNERLVTILNNLREQVHRFRVMYIKDIGSLRTLIEEHDEIVRAIEKKDIAGGIQAAQDHIHNQELRIISAISRHE
ncbi:MAG: GntR family transcriptional regulator [Clostridia bacterium]